MIETSIKKPLLILVLFTILTGGGLLCYNMLNLSLLPSFELPMITVRVVYPGASAAEVEASVTKRVEDALSTLENLRKITATSMENVSMIVLDLNEGTDPNQAVQDAQRKINAIKATLPAEVLDASVDKISPDEAPIISLAASSNLSPTEFYKLIEDRVVPRLSKLSGVGAVSLSGGAEREIKVNIDAQKLQAFGLSSLQVLQAIRAANMETPVGNVEDQSAVYSVRLMGKFTSLTELRNLVITSSIDGSTIRVIDVAEVEDGLATQKHINRIDNRDAIGITVQKQSDANTVRVVDLIRAELIALEDTYHAEALSFEVASDDAIFTRAAANSVVSDLFLAIFIVSIVCFIFLHNMRAALIILVSVPLAIVPAFIAMLVMGLSLNMMSLLALSLVVGLLVDDSVVMIENMSRLMEEGKSRMEAALEGARQIAFTCVSMTLVIVVVFMPLAISGGIIGNILKEFSIPIIASVLFSLLGTFTLTPLLMSRFAILSDNTKNTLSARFSRSVDAIFESLKSGYLKVLVFSLRYKFLTLLTVIILLIASFALFSMGLIGFTFVPETDGGEVTVTIDMSPQVTIYQNNSKTREVEQLISTYPEVERIYTNVGFSGRSTKNNASTINVKLVERNARNIETEAFARLLKSDLQNISGIRTRVTVKSATGGGGDGAAIQYIVQGTDFDAVEEAASNLLEIVRRTPGVVDARYALDDPRQEIQVRLDRDKIAAIGLSVADIGQTLRVALSGADDTRFSEGDYEYRIRVGIDNFNRTNANDLALLTVLNRQGQLIELKQFADITYGLGATALARTDRIPSISIRSGVEGRPAGTVGAEINEKLGDIAIEGVSINQAGTMEMQSTAFAGLAVTFIAALVLIYLMLVALYNSLTDPIIVLFSVPLALIGAFLALALTLSTLNIFSIIGLIVLIGVVAKNAILLVDFANEACLSGKDTYTAILESGKERLRPILMTTVSTILAMLPIALASGSGAEIKTGMAWVLIGGLTSSMLLTIIVIPVIYYIFDRIPSKIRRKRVLRRRQIRKLKEVIMRY